MKAIEALSAGWRTDLIFARFDGELIERPDCLVVRTPSNPSFWWGNFLLFDRAPRAGDATAWRERFDAEVARGRPEVRHVTFGVDAREPFVLPDDFVEQGFDVYASNVLTMRRPQLRAPRELPPGFRVGTLRLPEHAAEAVELQVRCDAGEHEPVETYRVFRQRQIRRYESMVRAGMGDWWGVFAQAASGERIVADCGLFHAGAGSGGTGRFQHVETDPEFRRRGLCSALIHAACRHGFEVLGLDTLVIVADPQDVAIRLYESVGFERGAASWHIERRPDAPAP